MDLSNVDWMQFGISMAVLVICITIHEFAHAYSAYRAGDDTPRVYHRLSLNPLDHLDPIGTVMMVLSSLMHFGIGWGKPVRINPLNFKHPRWDNLMVSFWGPLSNILTAVFVGLTIRFWGPLMSEQVYNFVFTLVDISIWLALFNLIPISPLDGSHILSSLLPLEQARTYESFMGRYGMFLFFGLIVFAPDVLPKLIMPPADMLLRLILGG